MKKLTIGAVLTCAGSLPFPSIAQSTLSAEQMFELAQGLGAAKNRQDVGAALTFMHEDVVLTSPAWGAIARGKQENAAMLTHFFKNYPDYEVSFEDYVADAEHFVGWGTVRMTMATDATDGHGTTPNGKRIELPVTVRMTFKDGLIATEHFMIDLAQIAGQSGISIDRVWENVYGASPQAKKNGE